jgi:hypothetical protein
VPGRRRRPTPGKKRATGAGEEVGGRGRHGRPAVWGARDLNLDLRRCGPAQGGVGQHKEARASPAAVETSSDGGCSFFPFLFYIFYYYLCQEVMWRTCV